MALSRPTTFSPPDDSENEDYLSLLQKNLKAQGSGGQAGQTNTGDFYTTPTMTGGTTPSAPGTGSVLNTGNDFFQNEQNDALVQGSQTAAGQTMPPGGSASFLAGDQQPATVYPGGSAGFDENVFAPGWSSGGAFGTSDPNFPTQGPYTDLDLTRQGPDYGYGVGPDGSGWAQTIAGPRQIAPAGTYGPDGKVLQKGAAPTSGVPTSSVPGGGTTRGNYPMPEGGYENYVRQLMGDSNDPNRLREIAPQLAQYGITLSAPNAQGELSKIILPDGTAVRVIGAGEGHLVYLPQPGTGSVPGGPGGGGLSGLEGGLFDILMQQARQNPNVGPNDPIIRGQTDAYDAAQQRSRRNYLQQLAESAGPGANIGAETRASAEQTGINTAAYQAGLMGSERQALRAQIQAALSGGLGYLSAAQQRALSEKLHLLDLTEQGYEFDTNDQYRNSPLAHL